MTEPVEEGQPPQGSEGSDDLHNEDGSVDWQKAARKWERQAKANATAAGRLKELEPELESFRNLAKTDIERKDEEIARLQSDAQTWRRSAVSARIEALATTDFAYPADAVAKLDPADYLDASGAVDEQQIQADLEALLAERPNWRRQSDAPGPRLPAPNHAQGTGGRAATTPEDHMNALIRSTRSGQ